MEEGGGSKRRVVGDASEEREEQRSPACDGGQTKKAFNRATPSWIPHATVNKPTRQVDDLVEKAERERKVRTISDSQRNFAAQFSTSAADRGAEKPVSGSRWTQPPLSSSDTKQNLDGAGQEAFHTQGAGQSCVGRDEDDELGGEPPEDQGGGSGDESQSSHQAPVRENGERQGEEAKEKPKALGQSSGGLVKGPWTKEEDQKIIECIAKKMTRWSEIAECVEGRVGKQCRERWFNHLDPTLKKGSWTPEEDEILVNGQAHFGNSWTKIGKLLPGRSENAVKNRWNSAARKKGIRNRQRTMAGSSTVGVPPERRLGGQVRYVPVPSWKVMPQIHHIHGQIAPSAASILASPPIGMDANQMLQPYPGGITHPVMNGLYAFPVHQAPVLDPSRMHAGGFGQMAPCHQMYGQTSVFQPAFPMAGRVVPGPVPGPVLPEAGNNSQQPTPNHVSASPPSATVVKEAEKGTQEGPNGVAVEEDKDKDKDDSQDDDELSLSNIMLNMSLEDQTNMVGSYNGCKSSHRMAELMGRENVFDACNGDPVLGGLPEDDFGAMCCGSFDGIFDIGALDSYGQESNLGLQKNCGPTASDLLTSPTQTEKREA
eukprot:g6102.t2